MKKNVFLLGINILIKVIDSDESVGSIIIPDEAKKNEELAQGIVKQKGPGFLIPIQREKDDMQSIIDGKDEKSLEMSFISLDINEGDMVYFPKQAASAVRLDGVNYVIVPYPAIKMFTRD